MNVTTERYLAISQFDGSFNLYEDQNPEPILIESGLSSEQEVLNFLTSELGINLLKDRVDFK